MLDIREIEYWISRYEQEADKLDHCVTLSALYSIRDKMLESQNPQPQIAAYSRAAAPATISAPLGLYGDSDFLRVAQGKEPAEAWAVMDRLMDRLNLQYPRAYNRVMREMREL